jgi:adenosylcobinamide-phosphate synthase
VNIGLLLDRALGEPPLTPHPLTVFGALLARVEAGMPGRSRATGVAYTAVGASVGWAADRIVPRWLGTYLACGGRALHDAALAVHRPLVAGDLDAARALLPSLVGRDPSALDAGDIARAVVESVAENTVDAIVAPAVWGSVGAALTHRAIDTMDSTVGYRNERYEQFGWASARLDDAAAFVPARLTAALVGVVRPARAASVLRAVLRDAPAHPSPNAGVAEAAFAAALELRLGGPTPYAHGVEDRPELGDGKPPSPADIVRAVDLSRDVTFAAVLLCP